MSTQPAATKPAASAKLSPVEAVKENSRQLRGTIALELAGDVDHFNEQNKQLIKFHGSYQQDDRDARKNRNKDAVGKYYIFMVRCKIPGGKVTAKQYLELDRIASQYSNDTLRITSRQGIQFHGVVKGHLKDTIAGINHSMLTTLGACGDVTRNVMAPPAPIASPVYDQLQGLADEVARYFAPRSGAYHEIWLNGKEVEPAVGYHAGVNGNGNGVTHATPSAEEPIYGKVYLPRKFKIGFALPDDNLTDIYAQDLGFLADVQDGRIVGFDVLVGGGMGMSHGNANTFPFMARHVCYIRPDQVVAATEANVKLFRDHGNRADRKRARIKYVVHDWGIDKYREVLATYLPFPLVLPKDIDVKQFPLWLGWHEQGDGKFFYGINVENGRIRDEGDLRQRTAIRTLVERLKPTVRLTPMQDILLCDLPESAKAEIEKVLTEHGVPLPGTVSRVQQLSMACPAIPTCGLAISEAERALPNIVDELEAELTKLGLDREDISVRMTGCPNGCVRPYQSDIGIVGRSGDKYTLFVGGNVLGTRLNFLFKDLVPQDQIVPTLRPVLAAYRERRRGKEGFGDFCQRLGQEALTALVTA